jgi:hypothetical protein
LIIFNYYKPIYMKNFYTSAFLILAFFSFSQIPTSGLIGGWPFTGNANDMSGTGNHGTVTGATLTTDRFGASNCAYSFNGTSDYITMLAAGPTGTVSRSVSFWERSTNSTLGARSGFSYGSAGGGGIFQINFNYACQAVGFDNSGVAIMHGGSMLNNGQWHHIVAVLDATTGIQATNVKFYVDGVLQSAITCSVGSISTTINSNSGLPIRVGLDVPPSSGGVRYFKGDLDDFYMYNRAITPAEVLQLYNYSPCTAAPTDPGLIAGNNTICSGAANIYSVAPVAGATSYTWSLPGGWTGTSSSNTISAIPGVNSGIISVIAGNGCGNSQPSAINVTVNPSPSLLVTATQFTICKGNSTSLTASGASTYTWNSFIVAPGITVSPTITSNYTLVGTNSFGCTSQTVTTVNVTNNTLPTISVSGPSLSCSGQNINLASNGASTYTWQPGSLSGFFVSVSPTITTVYTVTGTDANGCYNSATYTQSVSSCAGITAITGNEKAISIYPNPFISSLYITLDKNIYSSIRIYDVIGSLVYSSEIENDKITIDLSDKASGIYFITVSGKQGKETKKLIKQ